MATKKKVPKKKTNVVRTNFKQGGRKAAPRSRPGDFDPDANVKQVDEIPAPSVADMPSSDSFAEPSRSLPRYDEEPF
jgi:hypothetical protein